MRAFTKLVRLQPVKWPVKGMLAVSYKMETMRPLFSSSPPFSRGLSSANYISIKLHSPSRLCIPLRHLAPRHQAVSQITSRRGIFQAERNANGGDHHPAAGKVRHASLSQRQSHKIRAAVMDNFAVARADQNIALV